MRNLVPRLGLVAALLTSSCQAFGATRGFAIVAALLTGALAWLAHRSHAHAGGGTGTTTGGDTGTTDTGTAGSSTADTEAGSSASPDSSAGNESVATGPCLTAPQDDTATTSGTGTDTDLDPELVACLCACDTNGDRDAADWAPAVLLPAIALRRRNRRRSLERIAAAGRLPEDVVARLRQRLDSGD